MDQGTEANSEMGANDLEAVLANAPEENNDNSVSILLQQDLIPQDLPYNLLEQAALFVAGKIGGEAHEKIQAYVDKRAGDRYVSRVRKNLTTAIERTDENIAQTEIKIAELHAEVHRYHAFMRDLPSYEAKIDAELDDAVKKTDELRTAYKQAFRAGEDTTKIMSEMRVTSANLTAINAMQAKLDEQFRRVESALPLAEKLLDTYGVHATSQRATVMAMKNCLQRLDTEYTNKQGPQTQLTQTPAYK